MSDKVDSDTILDNITEPQGRYSVPCPPWWLACSLIAAIPFWVVVTIMVLKWLKVM